MNIPSFALHATLLMGALAVTTPLSVAAEADRDTSFYNLGEGGLALEGFDPVAYFDEGGAAATRGLASLSLEHDGVVYHFASDENRQLFVGNPGKYEPTHGGWCAYAMSKDVRYKVDPQAFLLSEGRLTLFADLDYVEFDGKWVPEQHESLALADKNWLAFSGEAARRAPKGSYRSYEAFNLSGASLAMEGFDPVSYFHAGGAKPQKGNARWSHRVGGVVYHFVSEKHLELFRADPSRYEPAHGGWCSYAMGASAEKVEVDPKAYRMTDGQLHLFFNTWYADTRDDWDEDTARLKKKADSNWAKILEKEASGR